MCFLYISIKQSPNCWGHLSAAAVQVKQWPKFVGVISCFESVWFYASPIIYVYNFSSLYMYMCNSSI